MRCRKEDRNREPTPYIGSHSLPQKGLYFPHYGEGHRLPAKSNILMVVEELLRNTEMLAGMRISIRDSMKILPTSQQ